MGMSNYVLDEQKKQADRIWQEAFDNYCIDHFGGVDPEGRDHDEAEAAADAAVEEWEEEQRNERD